MIITPMLVSRYAKKFIYALAGLWYVLRRETSFQLQAAAGLVVVAVAVAHRLPPVRWAVILLAIGAVLAAEIFNTALERLLDIVEPRMSQHVALLKDLLAAAVGVIALAATVSIVLAFY